ncbi:tetratricopeptide repeat protein, partial [Clostridium perfringens]|nr:tetratricopeptide repeat protein [Clostridium perfringens]
MSKYDKKLKKALAQYENGNYEEALDICEKVLDKDYNNEEALILEGRALEKLNRISDAIVSWKINSEYNNNEEARTKLEKLNNIDEKKLAMSTIFSETMKDEIKARLQEEAQKEYAKQLEKREPETKPEVKKTEKVKENKKVEQAPVININKETQKEKEDIKIDDIKISEPVKETQIKETPKTENKHLDNVTKVDFHKKDCKVKETKEAEADDEPRVISTPNFKNEKSNAKKSNKKKPVKYIAVAVSGAIVLLLAYGVTKNIKTTNASNSQVTSTEESTNQVNNSTENKSSENSSTENKTLNLDELNKAIENKDINSLYTILTSTPKDAVPADALDAYNKAETLMKTDGVKDLYLKGSDLFKEKKYEDALKDFEKAYAFSDGSYLKPHLIYFMGTSYENLDKNTEAIKYFQEYLKDYKAKPDA